MNEAITIGEVLMFGGIFLIVAAGLGAIIFILWVLAQEFNH